MKYYFTKEIYDKEALLKAAYHFTDVAYMHLDADDENYIVYIEMKNCKTNVNEKAFQNEILAQMVRQRVADQTRTVRELMIARGFSSTVINRSEENYGHVQNEFNTEADLNNILMDWFEKYE